MKLAAIELEKSENPAPCWWVNRIKRSDKGNAQFCLLMHLTWFSHEGMERAVES